jgi:hypothetical protein
LLPLATKFHKVPKGRLNLAQDAVLGSISEDDSVPQGRLKTNRVSFMGKFQSSLRDFVPRLATQDCVLG